MFLYFFVSFKYPGMFHSCTLDCSCCAAFGCFIRVPLNVLVFSCFIRVPWNVSIEYPGMFLNLIVSFVYP